MLRLASPNIIFRRKAYGSSAQWRECFRHGSALQKHGEIVVFYYLETGTEIAMNPAGGIRTARQALIFLVAVKETLGDNWLNNTRYRFGASAFLNDLVCQLVKEKTGNYEAPYTFSEAAGRY
jgi:deoxyribose-phosphate aldolase